MSRDSPLLIETIRIQNGRVRYIDYHNRRCNGTRKDLFGSNHKIDLRQYIDTTRAFHPETKCRITYDDSVHKVEYEAYERTPLQTLQSIEIESFEYNYKFADRSKIAYFFARKGRADDILMLRNGFITDTSYANVALLKDGKWYTPRHPLLQGSARARHIKNHILTEADIHVDELQYYEKMMIFNAMIPFGAVELDIGSIYRTEEG